MTAAAKPAADLSVLTAKANDLHRSVRDYQHDALHDAKRAGDVLAQIKSRMTGRGNWSRWLRDSFDGSPRTAQVYLRIAAGWDTIGPAVDRGDVASLNDALRLLGTGRPRAADRPTVSRKEVIARVREVVEATDDDAVAAIGKNWPHLAQALRLLRDLVG